jgi:hypothetical protein
MGANAIVLLLLWPRPAQRQHLERRIIAARAGCVNMKSCSEKKPVRSSGTKDAVASPCGTSQTMAPALRRGFDAAAVQA